MELNRYLFDVGELKYCKDLITDRTLLVKDIKHGDWLPSNGEDFTLYVLKDGVVYHYSNLAFSQVELKENKDVVEEGMVKEEKISLKKGK